MLLPRDFFARPSTEVAPDLLGCVLEHETADGLVAVELTEVEAYAGASDPGLARVPGPDSAERGDVRPARARLRVLHLRHALLREPGLPGRAGRLAKGASAVLLRAGAIVAGEELARARRTRETAPREAAPGERRSRPGPGPRPGPALPGARHRPGARRRRCLRRRVAAAGQDRDGNVTSFGRNSHRTAGRGEQRGRGPLAVLAGRGPDGVGVPGRRASPAQTGYPLMAGKWHHSGVDDIIDELSWRGPDRR